MKRYQHILCTTDFSDYCRAAAERAVEMAQLYGARLTLLHVVEYFPVDMSNEIIGPEDIDPAVYREQRVRDALAKLAKDLKTENAMQQILFSTESAKHEIVRFAKEQNVDLIVLASHGRHGVFSILGSTAYAVSHRAPCDVMMVRA